MKYLFFIFLAIFIINLCTAQSAIGINTGYTYNHLNTDISNRALTENTNKGGYGFGLQIKHEIKTRLYLQTGIYLLQKNYSFNRIDDYIGIYETFNNSYIQIPLNIQFKAFKIKRVTFIISTGVYGAYWFYSKVYGTTPNIFDTTQEVGNDGEITQNLTVANFGEKYKFNSLIDNRFEYGFDTGLQLDYKVNSKYSIFLDSNYYQSLTDQQKKYMINQVSKTNQTLCISIGCLFKFSTK